MNSSKFMITDVEYQDWLKNSTLINNFLFGPYAFSDTNDG